MLDTFAQYFRSRPMVAPVRDGGMHWLGVVWGILMLVLFVLAIIALWHYIASAHTSHHAATTGDGRSPLDIAKERYAKGEITKEQFASLKKDLKD